MALHLTPQEHDENPPRTWEVVKKRAGLWHLRQRGQENPIDSFATKREAEESKKSGRLVDLYENEGRWFRGEHVPGWKPYKG